MKRTLLIALLAAFGSAATMTSYTTTSYAQPVPKVKCAPDNFQGNDNNPPFGEDCQGQQ